MDSPYLIQAREMRKVDNIFQWQLPWRKLLSLPIVLIAALWLEYEEEEDDDDTSTTKTVTLLLLSRRYESVKLISQTKWKETKKVPR